MHHGLHWSVGNHLEGPSVGVECSTACYSASVYRTAVEELQVGLMVEIEFLTFLEAARPSINIY